MLPRGIEEVFQSIKDVFDRGDNLKVNTEYLHVLWFNPDTDCEPRFL